MKYITAKKTKRPARAAVENHSPERVSYWMPKDPPERRQKSLWDQHQKSNCLALQSLNNYKKAVIPIEITAFFEFHYITM